MIRNMLQRSSVRFDRLLGIGISVPGMVDDEPRKIVLATNLERKNVNIGTRLMWRFNIPIYVENESMVSAICEN
jgi:N-acetylglucosamine repressor